MDDPDVQWPAWKFGMKREELFTTLHDQYNTVTFSVQDPEAFHHDVYEISNVATTTDEFHRLLSDRKEQRIRELNKSLESASFEIISNPSLIGTQQWQYAVQLFRTRSLDSLVRYFASYLPNDHPWYHSEEHTTSDQSRGSSAGWSFFDDDNNGCGMTQECSVVAVPASHFPPSPKSMTMCSDESAAVSPTEDDTHHHYSFNAFTPARTSSFSEPETDCMTFSGVLLRDHDDETSQPEDPDTPTTSISDISETRSLPDYESKDGAEDESITPLACDVEETEEGAQESETPTQRKEISSGPYINTKARANIDPTIPLRWKPRIVDSAEESGNRTRAEVLTGSHTS
ncbi:hypothetical protein DL770_008752 [Monosporascus sp. CRB-9-2]|nr:hypothetical protein DL770_008752 [Monosporascus sp. CRB-9-2]